MSVLQCFGVLQGRQQASSLAAGQVKAPADHSKVSKKACVHESCSPARHDSMLHTSHHAAPHLPARTSSDPAAATGLLQQGRQLSPSSSTWTVLPQLLQAKVLECMHWKVLDAAAITPMTDTGALQAGVFCSTPRTAEGCSSGSGALVRLRRRMISGRWLC